MKRIITLTVQNRSGVLNRVTGMLQRRQFNIESISVGETETPGVSKMTLVVEVNDHQKIEQLTKQLNKQIDAALMKNLYSGPCPCLDYTDPPDPMRYEQKFCLFHSKWVEPKMLFHARCWLQPIYLCGVAVCALRRDLVRSC